MRLQKLVTKQLTSHAVSKQKEVMYSFSDTSRNLTTGDIIDDFAFQHPAADTMLLSAHAKLLYCGYVGIVVVDSEDTDVYVQSEYVSHALEGDLHIKRKGSYISCDTMLQKNIANVIITIHISQEAIMNQDMMGTVKSVIEKVLSGPNMSHLFEGVGKELKLSDEVRSSLKSFELSSVYCESPNIHALRSKGYQMAKTENKKHCTTPTGQ